MKKTTTATTTPSKNIKKKLLKTFEILLESFAALKCFNEQQKQQLLNILRA